MALGTYCQFSNEGSTSRVDSKSLLFGGRMICQSVVNYTQKLGTTGAVFCRKGCGTSNQLPQSTTHRCDVVSSEQHWCNPE